MAGETATEYLRDLWYMPALASSLKRGDMRREMLLGEPVLLGRNHSGEIFALRDICPHRGVPLSACTLSGITGASASNTAACN